MPIYQRCFRIYYVLLDNDDAKTNDVPSSTMFLHIQVFFYFLGRPPSGKYAEGARIVDSAIRPGPNSTVWCRRWRTCCGADDGGHAGVVACLVLLTW